MKKVFLGGTCNGSTWRKDIIPMLDNINVDYFNPVVDVWDSQAQIEEIVQREHCDIVLYGISSEMTGVYSIAEAVDDSNKRPEKTILCVLYDGFNAHQESSLKSVGRMIESNGATYVESLDMVINKIKNIIAESDDSNE